MVRGGKDRRGRCDAPGLARGGAPGGAGVRASARAVVGAAGLPVVLASCWASLGGGGPIDAFERDGVVYRARSAVVSLDPLRIRTDVLATNGKSEAVRTTPVGCAVYFRLYRTPERSGLPAWDSEVAFRRWAGKSSRRRLPSELCEEDAAGVELVPGEVRPVRVIVTEPALLGTFVPAGRYYFTVLVPFRDRRVELASGSVGWSEPGGTEEKSRARRE